ncbi:MAG: hypothetical protein EHM73_10715 [Chroococcales cyanobacterium metabat2.561]|jgi:hypothetical protein|uniref:Uncharacterized protein n=1 Tax=Microcystis aeruginosa Ma_SC_T_19800800_S464 TaxID=2486257 RepID=A0A552DFA5_MICAE|nr:MAG: hypothetical protein EHM73_10715 [Chroococcales cyanobacterium metabat2.561]TRU20834.1 MAG: hypothetical protein EWV81_21320 [Microcystis aeruginosa Ma_SC_T_19800800_S464]
MNAKCVSYPKVSWGLGFKNPTQEDSYLKSAMPDFPGDGVINFQDLALFNKTLNFPSNQGKN